VPTSDESIVYAPGQSPFHAKGLVFGGARQFWEHSVPGGVAAVQQAVGDIALAEFAKGPFLASGWYDVLPIVPLSATAARLRGIPHSQFIRENAAWLAERDLRGVYRVILALASVEMVALRLGKLSMRYFDFGRAETNRLGAHSIESVRRGIPAPLASWFIFAADGFVPVALRLAGATSVKLRYGQPRPDGIVSGMPAVQIRFEIHWE
jgi:hypothetical protein